MPIITVTMGQGQTTQTQKKQLIESITASGADILGLPKQSFTILINELATESIGLGGITLEEILANRKQ